MFKDLDIIMYNSILSVNKYIDNLSLFFPLGKNGDGFNQYVELYAQINGSRLFTVLKSK